MTIGGYEVGNVPYPRSLNIPHDYTHVKQIVGLSQLKYDTQWGLSHQTYRVDMTHVKYPTGHMNPIPAPNI